MLAVLLSLVALADPVEPAAPTRKGNLLLTEVVDSASFICIGTVDELFTIHFADGIKTNRMSGNLAKEAQFARIRVERVLKGDASTKVVFHESWTTWTCDSTRDTPGERSLFMLGPGTIANGREDQRNYAESVLGTKHILRNINDGDGIVPIWSKGEVEYVVACGAPDSMAVPDMPYCSRFSSVVPWIETLIRFAPDALAIRAETNMVPRNSAVEHAEIFDLRVLADGSLRLAIGRGSDERTVVDKIAPTQWAGLRARLLDTVGDTHGQFGDPKEDWGERRLFFLIDARRYEFVQGRDQDLSKVEDGAKERLGRALRAWSTTMELLDCPSCYDHRPGDRRVMDSLKQK